MDARAPLSRADTEALFHAIFRGELAEEELVEKRRGLGMYVTEGAREKLLASERDRFLKEEWPLVVERIQRLGLDIEKLMNSADKESKR